MKDIDLSELKGKGLGLGGSSFLPFGNLRAVSCKLLYPIESVEKSPT